ncbi:hypothetical protein SLS56_009954 [Neofusicoccum ribis]|uniref:BZIP transcription factor n=1 Tax=Neofusicoccum ribis TaxID=45134 RepID=A0ABR3SH70_9PEZI
MTTSGSAPGEMLQGAPPRRRRRVVASLTDQQAQRKRDLDRRAQRALRERTKTRIQELEESLDQLKSLHAHRERASEDQIRVLQQENRALRACLGNVGRYAMDALSDGLAAESSALHSREPHNGTWSGGSALMQASEALTHASAGREELRHSQSDEEAHSADRRRASTVEQQATSASGRLVLPAPLNGSLEPVSGNSASKETGFPNPPAVSPFGQSPRHNASVWSVLPQHRSATCPLDHILLNLLASRRALKANDALPSTLIGPDQPSVKPILDTAVASAVHPVSRVMSEPRLRYPMPRGLTTYRGTSRPAPTYVTDSHAPSIASRPRVRDMLIEHPDKYPFAVFSDVYSQSVTVNWPYNSADALSQDESALNTIFDKHIRKLSNWTMSPTFRDFYPELAAAVWSHD